MNDEVGILGRAYGRPETARTVIAIGDSVTYGQHVDPEHRWTTVLEKLIAEPVINRGVCGDTTRGGLERFPQDVQNLRPRIVFIQFGFNDCNHWKTDQGLPRVSPTAFRANLLEMVQRVRKFGAKPILVSMFQADKGSEYLRWQMPYLEAIEVIRREQSMGFKNLWQDTIIPTIDGLHPTPEGHEVIAEVLASFL